MRCRRMTCMKGEQKDSKSTLNQAPIGLAARKKLAQRFRHAKDFISGGH